MGSVTRTVGLVVDDLHDLAVGTDQLAVDVAVALLQHPDHARDGGYGERGLSRSGGIEGPSA